MTDLADTDLTSGARPDPVPAGPPWVVPTSLSPSRVESFLSCPLSFRFSSIEKLPDLPSVASTRGSLVHRALELLFVHPAAERTPEAFDRAVEAAIAEYRTDPDFTLLDLTPEQTDKFDAECRALTANYLEMEDPTQVREIGLELRLEAAVGDLTLRGIIDRLELDADGELIVTDYKTGRAPSPNWERKSLSGLNFYSFLCESLFGKRPAAIRLMYLSSKETITATPSEQSTKFLTTRTNAVWKAVATACERDDFRARQGPLCNYCSYQQWCPEFGGNPELAATEAPVVLGRPART
ncbi:MAG: PD-(D/E)XK nuclease family protein [Ilumatobacteraceae bacterium]|nr:PD-(D/E)XK nuclease family protein [Ilumatobacteraceae bacterium]